MPIWFIYAAIAGLGSNFSNIVIRHTLKDGDDATTFGWYFDVSCFVVSLVIFLFNAKLILSIQAVVTLLALALSRFVSIYLYVKMHQNNHLSISTIISRLRIIWIPLVAFFLVGERLLLHDYISIFIVFLGVAIVVSPRSIVWDKSIWMSIIYTMISAFSTVMTKEALQYTSVSGVLMFASLGTVVLFPVGMKDAQKRLISGYKSKLSKKVLAAFFNIIACYFFMFALNADGPVSSANVVYQSMMIIGVLTGIIYFNERDRVMIKLLGSILALLGMWVLVS